MNRHRDRDFAAGHGPYKGRLLLYWVAEATVGSIVTWLFGHLGDIATFAALAGSALSMATTVLVVAPLHFVGAVLALFGNLAFPFVGAQTYEQAEGRPIAAVVRGENRTGTTWENTSVEWFEEITRNPPATIPPTGPGDTPPTTDGPTNGPETTPPITEPPTAPPTIPPQTGGPTGGPPGGTDPPNTVP